MGLAPLLLGTGFIGTGSLTVFGATVGTFGAAAIRTGLGLLASTAVSALFAPSLSQNDLGIELRRLTSRIVKRYAYGRRKITATPVRSPVVGEYLYQAWVLNSRPSEGNYTFYFDTREVQLTGDISDLTEGGGATATNEPFVDHVTLWVTNGDNTSPPYEFTDEAGHTTGNTGRLWKTTDAGKGCTIVWARLKAGDQGQRGERWFNGRPVLEVHGDFSKVYDSRDPNQDADDSTTWEFSRNPFLIAADVVTQNPIRPEPFSGLHLSSLESSANVADETVNRKDGATEPRFQCDGIVTFDGSEIESLVEPVLATAAGRLSRVGGKLGFVPGAARTSTAVVADSYDGLTYSSLVRDDERATHIRVTYSPSERGNEATELEEWAIPGALAKDNNSPALLTINLDMITSDSQVQRVRSIYGLSKRQQRQLSLVAPMTAMELIGGSIATVTLPAPYSALNGSYEVLQMDPTLDMAGESGVPRIPMTLGGYSDSVYAWDETTDEVTIEHPDFDGSRVGISTPGAMTFTTYDTDLGSGYSPTIEATFSASTSSSLRWHEWQYRISNPANGAEDGWQTGGFESAVILNSDGDSFFHLQGFNVSEDHDFRVRAVTTDGEVSEWVTASDISYGFAISTASIVAGPGRARATGTAPTSEVLQGVRIWRAASGAGFGAAVDVSGILPVTSGASFDVTAGDGSASNEVTNGTFDTDTDWTKGTGWSIASGKATKATGTQSSLVQALTLSGGETCRITFTVSDRTAGTMWFRLTGDTTIQSVKSTNGTHSFELTAPANTTEFSFIASSTFDGSVDDVFVVIDSATAIEQGAADFYVTPASQSGTDGAEDGPFSLIIP